MWFWLFIIILLIGICLVIVGSINWYQKNNFLYNWDESIKTIGCMVSAISSTVVVIMLIIILCSYTNLEAKLEEDRELYNALTYKMESTTCRDEFGFLSKEVIDEVQEWNKHIRYKKAAQNDFWIGIFYPNVYDEFETIDYETYNNN